MNFPEKIDTTLIPISTKEYTDITSLIYDRIGIKLDEGKQALLVGRLNKILKVLGFKTYSEYYQYLKTDSNGSAISKLADSISTNHTFFHREPKHFEYYYQDVLPEIITNMKKAGKPIDLRVWCAASSSGEEPYTLAMLQRKYFDQHAKLAKGGLLATDISDKILQIAKAGIYTEEQVKPLPVDLKNNFFNKLPDNKMQVIDSIRKDVIYRRFNLMDPLPFKKPFHTIFCRNVMIYFDQPTKDKLIQKFFDCMEPGGYLFIGHAESIPKQTCPFKYIKPAVYKKEE